MTEDDLVEDLSRLLREGLAVVEVDQLDGFPDVAAPAIPRFTVTAKGREVLRAEGEPIAVVVVRVDVPEDRR